MTSDILDSIDGALQDWETSGDAMRWSPGLAEARGRAVAGAPAPLVPALRSGLSLTGPGGPWIPVGTFADGTVTLRREAPPLPSAAEFLEQFGRAVGEAAREFFRMMEPVLRTIHDVHKQIRPLEHRRCLVCHPRRESRGGGKLAVNGREYQRRLRNRRRRRH